MQDFVHQQYDTAAMMFQAFPSEANALWTGRRRVEEPGDFLPVMVLRGLGVLLVGS